MEEMNKSQGEVLLKELEYEIKSAWKDLSENEIEEVFNFADKYMKFLSESKTEREAVKFSIEKAKENGFVNIQEFITQNKELKAGDKVYFVNRNKNVFLAVIGTELIEKGINFVGAHIDAPRIDLKPNPLYEDGEMALFKTHYYGGIKKYQWVTIPLALHGVVIKKNGEVVDINIGENENEPVFCITDLLPHLAQDQMQKKGRDIINGEGLNILVGSLPYNDEKVKSKIKLTVLKILNDKYGITEEDFQNAELEIVPAGKARHVGIDSSMVGGYGQDDRVCAYAALEAILEIDNPKKTSICLLVDKEEVGSMGNTGMSSRAFENFIKELTVLLNQYNPLTLSRAFSNSKFLSADVDAAFDPTYAEVSEKMNVAYIGKGVTINKYTGHAGKAGGSDANAEFVQEITSIFNKNNVAWQSGEIGKVDQGGGGTIAYILANLGMDVLDCGTAILSMHAPFEVASKVDIYMTYKAYKAFYS